MHLSRLPTLAVVLSLWATLALADERVVDFHSDIRVRPDASLLVHEVIRVNSESQHIQHGIFRDFPTRYTSATGEQYIVGFKVIDVRRDGAQEAYTQEDLSNGVRIRIGSASRRLSPGEYTYELTYTVTRELGFFADHDELYWNVTGNGWIFPIDHATATVSLPASIQPNDLKLSGYTGPTGSRDQNLTFQQVDASTVRFQTTTPLGSNEGLTVVVGFPKGLVSAPSLVDRILWFIEDNGIVAAGLAGLIAVVIYYFAAGLIVGGGPRAGVIVVNYEPPSGVSPPAMRFLQGMAYDDRVMVSAVVDLAVRHCLTIQQEGRAYRLTQLRAQDSALPAEERNLLRMLFWNRTEVVVGHHGDNLQGAKQKLAYDLDTQENRQLFRKNKAWAWPGVLLTAASCAGMAISIHGPKGGGAGILMAWVSLWTVLTVAVIRTATPRLVGAVVVTLFEAAWVGILVAMIGLWPVLTVLAMVVTNLVGMSLLPSLTPAGRKLMDQIEGFKQYLMEVDSDRILRMNPPQKTPALFEKCLPYALALGVEQAWAKKFSGVLAQAAAVGAVTTAAYSPAWFSGTHFDTFDTGRFAESLSSDFSSAISSASSAASAPGSSSGFSDSSSSGGSDGGSSGGGGGGGGGGGW